MRKSRIRSTTRRNTPFAGRRARFEQLEPRLTLATYYPMPVADAIDGETLRHAVIQANASEEADTIVLCRGTYDLSITGSGEDAAATGDLDVTGTLTIRGAGQRVTTIDASALGDRAFDLLSGGNLVIKNATIRGGHAQQGGAIRVDEGDLTMIRCRLLENTAQGVEGGYGLGGAVYVDAGGATVRRCEFQDNEAIGADAVGGYDLGGFGRGGAIYLEDSQASISSTRFEDNSAVGGLASSEAPSTGGWGSGGAVFGMASDVTVQRSFFGSNSATGGSGLDGDPATAGGGASGGTIHIQAGSSLRVQKTVFDANTTRGGDGGNGPNGGNAGAAHGGAVYAAFDSEVVADACTFRGNEALGGDGSTGGVVPPPHTGHAGGDGGGGAIYAYIGTSMSIANSTFRDNRAVGGRGGDGAEGGYGGDGGLGKGGAVWSASEDGPEFAATLTISRSLLSNNEAVGGVAGQGESGHGHGGAAGGGGVLLGANVETSLVGVRILGNRAVGVGPAQGGGVDSADAKVAIIDSLFADNQALGGTGSYAAGGGIHGAKGTELNVSRTVFRGNVARGGEGIGIYQGGWGQGGAVSLLNSTGSFFRSVFLRNRTAGGTGGESSDGGGAEGGGIWHEGEAGSLDLTRCIFVHNRADGGAASLGNEMGVAAGGGIWAGPAESLLMTSCLVHRNSASGVTGRGGGIFLNDEGTGSAIIQRSIVTGNFASTEGNDIFGPYTT